MINLPYNVPLMTQMMPTQNVPVQTSHNNFHPFQQPPTNTQQMQTNPAYPVNPQDPYKSPFYQPHHSDMFMANQLIPNALQPRMYPPSFQPFSNAPPPLQMQPNPGPLLQNILEQIRGQVSSTAPIFILPGGCQQSTNHQQAGTSNQGGGLQAMGQPTSCNHPSSVHCPPSFYPIPIPMPVYEPFAGQARNRDGFRCCRCCHGRQESSKSKNSLFCCCDLTEQEDHRCTATNDDTICSKRNCPASVSLQALASQFLSLPGIVSCAATRLLLRKVPGSNITNTMEDTMDKAQKAISMLSKDQLLTESRNAQQVNALINLHMTSNPPANIIPLLTLLQLKVNVMKAQIESLINTKVMECQGFGYQVETSGPIDPTVLTMKTNEELRHLLHALRQKECDERVNVNFSPYHSQRVIAESRLNNVQAKIRQVENEFDRRRSVSLPVPSLTSRVIQQFAGTSCTFGYAQTRLFEPCESPDPFAASPSNPKRLYLKPHTPEPETGQQTDQSKATSTSEDTLPTSEDALPTSKDTLPTSKDTLPTSKDTLPTSKDTLPTSKDTGTGEGKVNNSEERSVGPHCTEDICSCQSTSSEDSVNSDKKKLRRKICRVEQVTIGSQIRYKHVSLTNASSNVLVKEDWDSSKLSTRPVSEAEKSKLPDIVEDDQDIETQSEETDYAEARGDEESTDKLQKPSKDQDLDERVELDDDQLMISFSIDESDTDSREQFDVIRCKTKPKDTSVSIETEDPEDEPARLVTTSNTDVKPKMTVAQPPKRRCMTKKRSTIDSRSEQWKQLNVQDDEQQQTRRADEAINTQVDDDQLVIRDENESDTDSREQFDVIRVKTKPKDTSVSIETEDPEDELVTTTNTDVKPKMTVVQPPKRRCMTKKRSTIDSRSEQWKQLNVQDDEQQQTRRADEAINTQVDDDQLVIRDEDESDTDSRKQFDVIRVKTKPKDTSVSIETEDPEDELVTTTNTDVKPKMTVAQPPKRRCMTKKRSTIDSRSEQRKQLNVQDDEQQQTRRADEAINTQVDDDQLVIRDEDESDTDSREQFDVIRVKTKPKDTSVSIETEDPEDEPARLVTTSNTDVKPKMTVAQPPKRRCMKKQTTIVCRSQQCKQLNVQDDKQQKTRRVDEAIGTQVCVKETATQCVKFKPEAIKREQLEHEQKEVTRIDKSTALDVSKKKAAETEKISKKKSIFRVTLKKKKIKKQPQIITGGSHQTSTADDTKHVELKPEATKSKQQKPKQKGLKRFYKPFIPVQVGSQPKGEKTEPHSEVKPKALPQVKVDEPSEKSTIVDDSKKTSPETQETGERKSVSEVTSKKARTSKDHPQIIADQEQHLDKKEIRPETGESDKRSEVDDVKLVPLKPEATKTKQLAHEQKEVKKIDETTTTKQVSSEPKEEKTEPRSEVKSKALPQVKADEPSVKSTIVDDSKKTSPEIKETGERKSVSEVTSKKARRSKDHPQIIVDKEGQHLDKKEIIPETGESDKRSEVDDVKLVPLKPEATKTKQLAHEQKEVKKIDETTATKQVSSEPKEEKTEPHSEVKPKVLPQIKADEPSVKSTIVDDSKKTSPETQETGERKSVSEVTSKKARRSKDHPQIIRDQEGQHLDKKEIRPETGGSHQTSTADDTKHVELKPEATKSKQQEPKQTGLERFYKAFIPGQVGSEPKGEKTEPHSEVKPKVLPQVKADEPSVKSTIVDDSKKTSPEIKETGERKSVSEVTSKKARRSKDHPQIIVDQEGQHLDKKEIRPETGGSDKRSEVDDVKLVPLKPEATKTKQLAHEQKEVKKIDETTATKQVSSEPKEEKTQLHSEVKPKALPQVKADEPSVKSTIVDDSKKTSPETQETGERKSVSEVTSKKARRSKDHPQIIRDQEGQHLDKKEIRPETGGSHQTSTADDTKHVELKPEATKSKQQEPKQTGLERFYKAFIPGQVGSEPKGEKTEPHSEVKPKALPQVKTDEPSVKSTKVDDSKKTSPEIKETGERKSVSEVTSKKARRSKDHPQIIRDQEGQHLDKKEIRPEIGGSDKRSKVDDVKLVPLQPEATKTKQLAHEQKEVKKIDETTATKQVSSEPKEEKMFPKETQLHSEVKPKALPQVKADEPSVKSTIVDDSKKKAAASEETGEKEPIFGVTLKKTEKMKDPPQAIVDEEETGEKKPIFGVTLKKTEKTEAPPQIIVDEKETGEKKSIFGVTLKKTEKMKDPPQAIVDEEETGEKKPIFGVTLKKTEKTEAPPQIIVDEKETGEKKSIFGVTLKKTEKMKDPPQAIVDKEETGEKKPIFGVTLKKTEKTEDPPQIIVDEKETGEKKNIFGVTLKKQEKMKDPPQVIVDDKGHELDKKEVRPDTDGPYKKSGVDDVKHEELKPETVRREQLEHQKKEEPTTHEATTSALVGSTPKKVKTQPHIDLKPRNVQEIKVDEPSERSSVADVSKKKATENEETGEKKTIFGVTLKKAEKMKDPPQVIVDKEETGEKKPILGVTLKKTEKTEDPPQLMVDEEETGEKKSIFGVTLKKPEKMKDPPQIVADEEKTEEKKSIFGVTLKKPEKMKDPPQVIVAEEETGEKKSIFGVTLKKPEKRKDPPQIIADEEGHKLDKKEVRPDTGGPYQRSGVDDVKHVKLKPEAVTREQLEHQKKEEPTTHEAATSVLVGSTPKKVKTPMHVDLKPRTGPQIKLDEPSEKSTLVDDSTTKAVKGEQPVHQRKEEPTTHEAATSVLVGSTPKKVKTPMHVDLKPRTGPQIKLDEPSEKSTIVDDSTTKAVKGEQPVHQRKEEPTTHEAATSVLVGSTPKKVKTPMHVDLKPRTGPQIKLDEPSEKSTLVDDSTTKAVKGEQPVHQRKEEPTTHEAATSVLVGSTPKKVKTPMHVDLKPRTGPQIKLDEPSEKSTIVDDSTTKAVKGEQPVHQRKEEPTTHEAATSVLVGSTPKKVKTPMHVDLKPRTGPQIKLDEPSEKSTLVDDSTTKAVKGEQPVHQRKEEPTTHEAATSVLVGSTPKKVKTPMHVDLKPRTGPQIKLDEPSEKSTIVDDSTTKAVKGEQPVHQRKEEPTTHEAATSVLVGSTPKKVKTPMHVDLKPRTGPQIKLDEPSEKSTLVDDSTTKAVKGEQPVHQRKEEPTTHEAATSVLVGSTPKKVKTPMHVDLKPRTGPQIKLDEPSEKSTIVDDSTTKAVKGEQPVHQRKEEPTTHEAATSVLVGSTPKKVKTPMHVDLKPRTAPQIKVDEPSEKSTIVDDSTTKAVKGEQPVHQRKEEPTSQEATTSVLVGSTPKKVKTPMHVDLKPRTGPQIKVDEPSEKSTIVDDSTTKAVKGEQPVHQRKEEPTTHEAATSVLVGSTPKKVKTPMHVDLKPRTGPQIKLDEPSEKSTIVDDSTTKAVKGEQPVHQRKEEPTTHEAATSVLVGSTPKKVKTPMHVDLKPRTGPQIKLDEPSEKSTLVDDSTTKAVKGEQPVHQRKEEPTTHEAATSVLVGSTPKKVKTPMHVDLKPRTGPQIKLDEPSEKSTIVDDSTTKAVKGEQPVHQRKEEPTTHEAATSVLVGSTPKKVKTPMHVDLKPRTAPQIKVDEPSEKSTIVDDSTTKAVKGEQPVHQRKEEPTSQEATTSVLVGSTPKKVKTPMHVDLKPRTGPQIKVDEPSEKSTIVDDSTTKAVKREQPVHQRKEEPTSQEATTSVLVGSTPKKVKTQMHVDLKPRTAPQIKVDEPSEKSTLVDDSTTKAVKGEQPVHQRKKEPTSQEATTSVLVGSTPKKVKTQMHVDLKPRTAPQIKVDEPSEKSTIVDDSTTKAVKGEQPVHQRKEQPTSQEATTSVLVGSTPKKVKTQMHVDLKPRTGPQIKVDEPSEKSTIVDDSTTKAVKGEQPVHQRKEEPTSQEATTSVLVGSTPKKVKTQMHVDLKPRTAPQIKVDEPSEKSTTVDDSTTKAVKEKQPVHQRKEEPTSQEATTSVLVGSTPKKVKTHMHVDLKPRTAPQIKVDEPSEKSTIVDDSTTKAVKGEQPVHQRKEQPTSQEATTSVLVGSTPKRYKTQMHVDLKPRTAPQIKVDEPSEKSTIVDDSTTKEVKREQPKHQQKEEPTSQEATTSVLVGSTPKRYKTQMHVDLKPRTGPQIKVDEPSGKSTIVDDSTTREVKREQLKHQQKEEPTSQEATTSVLVGSTPKRYKTQMHVDLKPRTGPQIKVDEPSAKSTIVDDSTTREVKREQPKHQQKEEPTSQEATTSVLVGSTPKRYKTQMHVDLKPRTAPQIKVDEPSGKSTIVDDSTTREVKREQPKHQQKEEPTSQEATTSVLVGSTPKRYKTQMHVDLKPRTGPQIKVDEPSEKSTIVDDSTTKTVKGVQPKHQQKEGPTSQEATTSVLVGSTPKRFKTQMHVDLKPRTAPQIKVDEPSEKSTIVDDSTTKAVKGEQPVHQRKEEPTSQEATTSVLVGSTPKRFKTQMHVDLKPRTAPQIKVDEPSEKSTIVDDFTTKAVKGEQPVHQRKEEPTSQEATTSVLVGSTPKKVKTQMHVDLKPRTAPQIKVDEPSKKSAIVDDSTTKAAEKEETGEKKTIFGVTLKKTGRIKDPPQGIVDEEKSNLDKKEARPDTGGSNQKSGVDDVKHVGLKPKAVRKEQPEHQQKEEPTSQEATTSVLVGSTPKRVKTQVHVDLKPTNAPQIKVDKPSEKSTIVDESTTKAAKDEETGEKKSIFGVTLRKTGIIKEQPQISADKEEHNFDKRKVRPEIGESSQKSAVVGVSKKDAAENEETSVKKNIFGVTLKKTGRFKEQPEVIVHKDEHNSGKIKMRPETGGSYLRSEVDVVNTKEKLIVETTRSATPADGRITEGQDSSEVQRSYLGVTLKKKGESTGRSGAKDDESSSTHGTQKNVQIVSMMSHVEYDKNFGDFDEWIDTNKCIETEKPQLMTYENNIDQRQEMMFPKSHRANAEKYMNDATRFSPLKHTETPENIFHPEEIESDPSEAIYDRSTPYHLQSKTKDSLVSSIYSVIENTLTPFATLVTNLINFQDVSNSSHEKSSNEHNNSALNREEAIFDWKNNKKVSSREDRNFLTEDANDYDDGTSGEGPIQVREIKQSIIVDKETNNYRLVEGSISDQSRKLSRIGFQRPYQTRRILVIRSRLKNPGKSSQQLQAPFKIVKRLRKNNTRVSQTKQEKDQLEIDSKNSNSNENVDISYNVLSLDHSSHS